MAIFYYNCSIVQRSMGQSIVASTSYQSGRIMTDRQTGETFNYTNKKFIAHNRSRVFLADGAPEEWQDAEVLANHIEAFEKNNDAQLGRSMTISMPQELTVDQQYDAACELAEELQKEGMCVILDYHHSPRWKLNKKNKPVTVYNHQKKIREKIPMRDENGNIIYNDHVHLKTTMRRINPQTHDFANKRIRGYKLDENGEKIPVLVYDENGKTLPELDKKGNVVYLKDKEGNYIKNEMGEKVPKPRQKREGKDGKSGRRLWEREDIKNGWDSKEDLERWKKSWENICNKHLEKAGCEERIFVDPVKQEAFNEKLIENIDKEIKMAELDKELLEATKALEEAEAEEAEQYNTAPAPTDTTIKYQQYKQYQQAKQAHVEHDAPAVRTLYNNTAPAPAHAHAHAPAPAPAIENPFKTIYNEVKAEQSQQPAQAQISNGTDEYIDAEPKRAYEYFDENSYDVNNADNIERYCIVDDLHNIVLDFKNKLYEASEADLKSWGYTEKDFKNITNTLNDLDNKMFNYKKRVKADVKNDLLYKDYDTTKHRKLTKQELIISESLKHVGKAIKMVGKGLKLFKGGKNLVMKIAMKPVEIAKKLQKIADFFEKILLAPPAKTHNKTALELLTINIFELFKNRKGETVNKTFVGQRQEVRKK